MPATPKLVRRGVVVAQHCASPSDADQRALDLASQLGPSFELAGRARLSHAGVLVARYAGAGGGGGSDGCREDDGAVVALLFSGKAAAFFDVAVLVDVVVGDAPCCPHVLAAVTAVAGGSAGGGRKLWVVGEGGVAAAVGELQRARKQQQQQQPLDNVPFRAAVLDVLTGRRVVVAVVLSGALPPGPRRAFEASDPNGTQMRLGADRVLFPARDRRFDAGAALGAGTVFSTTFDRVFFDQAGAGAPRRFGVLGLAEVRSGAGGGDGDDGVEPPAVTPATAAGVAASHGLPMVEGLLGLRIEGALPPRVRELLGRDACQVTVRAFGGPTTATIVQQRQLTGGVPFFGTDDEANSPESDPLADGVDERCEFDFVVKPTPGAARTVLLAPPPVTRERPHAVAVTVAGEAVPVIATVTFRRPRLGALFALAALLRASDVAKATSPNRRGSAQQSSPKTSVNPGHLRHEGARIIESMLQNEAMFAPPLTTGLPKYTNASERVQCSNDAKAYLAILLTESLGELTAPVQGLADVLRCEERLNSESVTHPGELACGVAGRWTVPQAATALQLWWVLRQRVEKRALWRTREQTAYSATSSSSRGAAIPMGVDRPLAELNGLMTAADTKELKAVLGKVRAMAVALEDLAFRVHMPALVLPASGHVPQVCVRGVRGTEQQHARHRVYPLSQGGPANERLRFCDAPALRGTLLLPLLLMPRDDATRREVALFLRRECGITTGGRAFESAEHIFPLHSSKWSHVPGVEAATCGAMSAAVQGSVPVRSIAPLLRVITASVKRRIYGMEHDFTPMQSEHAAIWTERILTSPTATYTAVRQLCLGLRMRLTVQLAALSVLRASGGASKWTKDRPYSRRTHCSTRVTVHTPVPSLNFLNAVLAMLGEPGEPTPREAATALMRSPLHTWHLHEIAATEMKREVVKRAVRLPGTLFHDVVAAVGEPGLGITSYGSRQGRCSTF